MTICDQVEMGPSSRGSIQTQHTYLPSPDEQIIMKHLLPLLASLTLTATLAAQTNACTTQVAGVGCGPQIDVTFTPAGQAGNHTIDLDVTGMNPAGIGLMVWGVDTINVPLFGCTAYTTFLWGHPINPDGAGDWSWSRSWPNSVQGFYRIQIATIGPDPQGNLEVNLTDCVIAECTQ